MVARFFAAWALVVVAAIVSRQPFPRSWPGILAIAGLAALSGWIALSQMFRWTQEDAPFAERGQLALVVAVLVPMVVYVLGIYLLGIYVASAIFVAFFMRWLGKYPWWKVAAVSIGNSVVFFLIFERWFLVPLPKGPRENLLGIA